MLTLLLTNERSNIITRREKYRERGKHSTLVLTV